MMNAQIDSDAVRNFKVPSRTRGLYMYFVLGALGIAAVSTSLSFSQAITDDFSDAVTSNYEWIEREGLYSELIRLLNACEEPIVTALETGKTEDVENRLTDAVKRFRRHLEIARKETDINVGPRERAPLIAELDAVSELIRNLEISGHQALQAKVAKDDARAIAHLAALNRNSQKAAQRLVNAFNAIRGSQGDRLEKQLQDAETLRGYQAWFAFGVLGLVVCVSFFGHRLSKTTHDSIRTMTKQAHALADQEARLRTIFATAAEGIVTIHPDGVIESCNAATLELFGCGEGEIVGRTLGSLMTHNPDAAVSDSQARAVSLESLVGQRQELLAERPDGTTFIVDFAAAEVRCNDHRVITGILHDITDRKLFEAKLDQARHAAEAATRAKSQFLANMSHEIRTPMTAILGFADLLREPEQSEEERSRCAETIHRNADHLLSLLDDILDLSKIEAGRMSVEQVECNPIDLVRDVDALVRQRAREKCLEFEVVLDSRIPETISGDPVRIRQILLNLVGNSIKFTNAGRVQLHMWTEDVDSEPALHFKVVDTGIGMSKNQIAQLFRPFTQADSTTTRQFGGTGLGLSICKRLVDMMGGNIQVTSVADVGSTFCFHLPTGDLDNIAWVDSYSQIVPAAENPIEVRTGRLTARVLLAEDSADNRRLISYHLQKAGATVVHTEDGQDTVQQARLAAQLGQPFDVILMDMQMPIMDGYQATAELRQLGYRLPIVALTAHAMSGDREKCINAGCDDYLTKPIVADELLDRVRRYWNQNRKTEQSVDQTSSESKPQIPTLTNSIEEPTEKIQPAISRPVHEETLVSEFADDPEMIEILAKFLTGLNDRIEEIDGFFIKSDWGGVTNVAHQLKGAAGGYGFPIISEVAAELERLSRATMESGSSLGGESSNAQVKSCLDRLVVICRLAIASNHSTSDDSRRKITQYRRPSTNPSLRMGTQIDKDAAAILDEIEVIPSSEIQLLL
jgi:PAS domain S-box-containing protein